MSEAPPALSQLNAKPAGFVHVDLDGLWTIAQTYGFAEKDAFEDDPIFTLALPRLLDLLDALEVSATFFIVGRDLEHPHKRDAVEGIARRGHELACHGYRHTIGMEKLDDAALRADIESSRDALKSLTQASPLGFRAPGYDAGPRTLSAAAVAGFKYDGSFLPAAPWAARVLRRAARNLRSRVALETGAALDSSDQYGGQYGGAGALEIVMREHPALPTRIRVLPLAVSARLRLPLHASLGMFLGAARVKKSLKAIADLRASPNPGLSEIALGAAPLTYLLHGMDAAAPGDFAGRLPQCLARHRGFAAPLPERMAFLRGVLGFYKELFEIQRTDKFISGQR